jgi:hypothetical protein
MSEVKYPDVIELKLKLCFSDAHNSDYMKKEVNLSAKALKVLETGVRVEGSMILNPVTNELEFSYWERKAPKRYNYRVMNHLPNSIMLESVRKVIVRSSVCKNVNRKDISKTMLSEMKCHMQLLKKEVYQLG